MAINFGVANADEFAKVLSLIQKEFTGLSAEAANEVAAKVLEDAKRRCPRKTGRLAETGKLIVGKTRKTDEHVVKIQFGDKKTAPYGAIVHFDPHMKHETGEVRYLYNATQAHAAELPQAIAQKLRSR